MRSKKYTKTRANKLVLDTGVLVEYIVERAPYRRLAAKLLEPSTSTAELYISPVTLSETLYVVYRIYASSGLPDPLSEAHRYLAWLRARVKLAEVDEETAWKAGELKGELGIALPDCYVIATAWKLGASPLFRKPEKEMERVLGRLREMGVLFLEDMGSLGEG